MSDSKNLRRFELAAPTVQGGLKHLDDGQPIKDSSNEVGDLHPSLWKDFKNNGGDTSFGHNPFEALAAQG